MARRPTNGTEAHDEMTHAPHAWRSPWLYVLVWDRHALFTRESWLAVQAAALQGIPVCLLIDSHADFDPHAVEEIPITRQATVDGPKAAQRQMLAWLEELYG